MEIKCYKSPHWIRLDPYYCPSYWYTVNRANKSFVTLDVSFLHNNIPNNDGIKAEAEHLRCDPTKHEIGPFIFKLLKLVLHSMNLSINGDHYLQTRGTEMGTSDAPIQTCNLLQPIYYYYYYI